jgi:hypothetical protein
MSRGARLILVAFLLLFVWMVLAGWSTDTPKQRVGSAVVAGFMLVLALGIAAPGRFIWALRVAAGAVAATYAVYFVTELVALLRGEPQPLVMGRPSATMAGLGLLVFGVPALVFALGAERVGLARLFGKPTEVQAQDLDKHSNER